MLQNRGNHTWYTYPVLLVRGGVKYKKYVTKHISINGNGRHARCVCICGRGIGAYGDMRRLADADEYYVDRVHIGGSESHCTPLGKWRDDIVANADDISGDALNDTAGDRCVFYRRNDDV